MWIGSNGTGNGIGRPRVMLRMPNSMNNAAPSVEIITPQVPPRLMTGRTAVISTM